MLEINAFLGFVFRVAVVVVAAVVLGFVGGSEPLYTGDLLSWLAQLVERQSAVREVENSSPRPD